MSYKKFVRTRIAEMPSAGRGQFRKLASQLRMHTTLVSQVFGGDRHLTAEQACDLGVYWGLSELETEMFLALVQYERAGSAPLRRAIEKQIEGIRRRSEKLDHRLPQEKKLTESAQAIFYSNWYYSGIRLLTSIPGFQTIDAIAERLKLPRKTVARVTDFLLAQGLCVKAEGGLRMGPQRTHLSDDSPLISRHRMNWRMKGAAKIENISDRELMFAAPLTLSEKDASHVRKEIVALIEKISGIVKNSKPEKLVCLNIDWFDV